MVELKTLPNDKSVTEFIDSIDDGKKRQDCWKLFQIVQEVSGEIASRGMVAFITSMQVVERANGS
jgi:hypothetical protein